MSDGYKSEHMKNQRYAGECDCEANGDIEPGEECECDIALPNRPRQQSKDDHAYGLLMEIILLAKAKKDYKPLLKDLKIALHESPAALELAKRCIKATEVQ